jgi:electron transfer flavoprotein alpha subunit
MKTLCILEHDNQILKPVNLHLLTAALALGAEIDALMMGSHCDAVLEKAEHLPYLKNIFIADNEVYAHQLAENCSALVAEMASQYDYIVGSATTFGKNLLPRVAALLDVPMVGDIVEVIAPDTFVRPIYAGNAFQTVKNNASKKVLSFRPTTFPEAKLLESTSAQIQKVDKVIPNPFSQFEKQTLTTSERPELTSAKIIISGGRGLKNAENFKLIEKLADRLGAAIGASRAAVDAGFAPNDYQVGQTGKVVAPDLYIAIGISGAIQHLAGMKDSKVIVAINNDPDAPIFQIADYGLVMDLFEALKELEKELGAVSS